MQNAAFFKRSWQTGRVLDVLACTLRSVSKLCYQTVDFKGVLGRCTQNQSLHESKPLFCIALEIPEPSDTYTV
jgi:hypothetical protein